MNKSELNRLVAWRLKLLQRPMRCLEGRSNLPTLRSVSQYLLQMES